MAFSTANADAADENNFGTATVFPNYALGAIFRAGIDATEEAIVNAMVAADTTIGIDGLRVKRLPHAEVRALFSPAGNESP